MYRKTTWRGTSTMVIACYSFITLVTLGNFSALSQINQVEDSLRVLLTRTNNDSVKISIYNQLRRATYYSDPVASQEYTFHYLETATKVEDSLQMALANYYVGNSYVTSGDFDDALTYYLKSAQYFESKEDAGRLGSVYNGVAAAYENNGNDSLSLKYFTMSYDLSSKANDPRRMGIALNNIGNIFKNRGEPNKAIEHLERARIHLNQPKFDIYYRSISLNLANIYIDVNRLVEAKSIFNEVLSKTDSVQDVYNYATALRGLGNTYFKEGNSKNALKYMEHAFNKYSQHNFKDERYETMRDLIDQYHKNNQNGKAMTLFYEYNTIKDSIFNADKDKNLTEALQKYEAAKKDKEIFEQNLTIEKKNQQKNRILFGLIAVALALVGLFLFFRKRLQYQKTIASQNATLQKQKITDLQQKNKLLAMSSMIEGQEAERLRIAKDLHDSLGGLLSTVKAHFTTIQHEIKELSQFDLTGRTNSLIDEACIEVRRISHNMMPHALSLSGLKGAIEDLGEYLSEEGYETTVEISNLPKGLDTTKEVMIYRLVQEIISNIRKHANAKHVLIQLIGHGNEINLIIEDDGVGFDYEKAAAKGGLGLKSINSRVQYLDGAIHWDTQANKGTSLTINIPTS